MTDKRIFDAIIVGGSYSGLSAGMTLGRALRNVLIIDSGQPCNIQTPHSHNFITQDGKTPKEISTLAKQQVKEYETVEFYDGLVTEAIKTETGFEVTSLNNDSFKAKKLIFATGVRDIMPEIKGFAQCWGISLIHCPYCHGYEVRNQKTGILANGDVAFHYAQLIKNWTKDLIIFTNGKSTLSQEQVKKIEEHHIPVIEEEIVSFRHENGNLKEVIFVNGLTFQLNAIYTRPHFEQGCKIPEELGCELTEQGFLKVDMFQKTSVQGIFACGDNASPLRAVSHAVATGGIAGAVLNNEMTEEEF
ncbi:MAG: NAD(P)/FAD-dependent oxidoreductase [Flavobacteriales bacterium]|nr:NAD(P)/FAD-dependent oxidoreductase [Flavobacteriales bacterium]